MGGADGDTRGRHAASTPRGAAGKMGFLAMRAVSLVTRHPSHSATTGRLDPGQRRDVCTEWLISLRSVGVARWRGVAESILVRTPGHRTPSAFDRYEVVDQQCAQKHDGPTSQVLVGPTL